MTKIEIAYRLAFDSPFHCGTGMTEGLINRSVVMDRDQYLYIPGSTIKGILRENCENIARFFGLSIRDPHDEAAAIDAFIDGPDIVEVIFGSRLKEGSLFFDHAVMSEEDKDYFAPPGGGRTDNYLVMQTEKRTQTALSRRTGTVKQGALYTSEFGISGLVFEGNIHGKLEGISNELSALPGPYSLFLLITGICLTEKIGSNRSAGMGKCRFHIENLQVDGATQKPEDYLNENECILCFEAAKEENRP